MHRNQLRNNQSSALYDIVFLMAAGFFILFVVALWYVNPIAKLGKIDNKAEFIITVTWPDDLDVDIDTWVMDPNGILIWFSSKSPNNSPVHLNRDDLGHSNDTIVIDNEFVVIKQNIEITAIRAILPGEYILNVHFYSNYQKIDYVEVIVKVEKLNPTVKRIFYTITPIILTTKGQEVTVVRFVVDVDGSVTNVSTGPPVSLIKIRNETINNTIGRRGGYDYGLEGDGF